MIKSCFQIIIVSGMLMVGFSSVQAQLCGQWRITVAVVDERDKPVIGSHVEFEKVDEGDAANTVKFKPTDGEEHTFRATFSEGSRSAKKYYLVISAPGFYDKRTEINNTYCYSSSNKIALRSNGKRRAVFNDVRTLSGHAMTNKGQAVGSVWIMSRSGDQYYVLTDKDGFYSIKLKPGTYSIDENFSSCDRFSSKDIVIGKKNVTYDLEVKCQM